jgi:HPt (histidine-containing phosphotransfer) domain-containing protein
LPESLPGIDLAAGLATSMGKVELYLRLLRKFRSSQGDFRADFLVARADSDASAAARLAHSLRGSAGNIGARSLAQAATALELACKEGATEAVLEPLVSEVERQLQPLLTGLAGLVEVQQGAAAVPALPLGAELQAQLDKLRRLLADSDTAAQDALYELQGQALDPLLAERLRQVAQQVECFDFDRALELLQGLS